MGQSMRNLRLLDYVVEKVGGLVSNDIVRSRRCHDAGKFYLLLPYPGEFILSLLLECIAHLPLPAEEFDHSNDANC